MRTQHCGGPMHGTRLLPTPTHEPMSLVVELSPPPPGVAEYEESAKRNQGQRRRFRSGPDKDHSFLCDRLNVAQESQCGEALSDEVDATVRWKHAATTWNRAY